MHHHGSRARAALLALTSAWAMGCSGGDDSTKPTTALPTYYADVKPILDAKCQSCHLEGGIGPFAFTTADQAIQYKDAIVGAAQSRRMPPWPPSAKSAALLGDRSLSDAQIDTLARWSAAGAPLGDPRDFVPLPGKPETLSRVDEELAIPEPYLPAKGPDDYRCFVIDWPHDTTKYVTGMGVEPGEASIVHHVVLFYAMPNAVPTYEAYDAADPAPGYSCFGGPRGDDPSVQGPSGYRILGGWAPGSFGRDMPAGTGIEVPPGAKLVLQMHYNLAHGVPAPDQTRVALKLDDTVEKPAYTMPWLNPDWMKSGTMNIPAGDPDVLHTYENDAVLGASVFSKGALPAGAPITLHSVGLHQHLRGKSISMSLERSSGEREMLVDIPRWDYHWQAPYTLAEPRRLDPGDKLRLECHFDNSAQNQPLVDGVKMPPKDLNWGEGTDDEMCLGWIYVTQ
jgi:hypothetical protein